MNEIEMPDWADMECSFSKERKTGSWGSAVVHGHMARDKGAPLLFSVFLGVFGFHYVGSRVENPHNVPGFKLCPRGSGSAWQARDLGEFLET
jgi:hypothetical protein